MILKKDLKKVLLKQREDLQRDPGTERDKKIKILPGRATIISGVRRCGKSTLARQYLTDASSVNYIRFEDINLTGFELRDFIKAEEIFSEISEAKGIWFFDEVQNIDGWEKYVRQLVDRGEKVIITGSNANILSRELGTKLTGRHISTELYPFSYKEFLKLLKKDHSVSLFKRYLSGGGFPEYLKQKDKELLRNLLQDIFYRDIMQRNELRSESSIKALLHYAISNTGRPTSYHKLKDLVNVGSVNSISQFIDHFETAYVLFELRKYDYSLRKQIKNPKKLYCIDSGIISQNAFSFSENRGRMLENLVFLQLKRQGKEVFYHKENKECDFIIKEGNSIRQAFQVCYELNSDNEEREIEGLLEAMLSHKLREGFLITHNDEDKLRINKKQIRIIPAWKWLLA
ncbi:MAG TPA: ATP-binding protein [Bacteroidales bacterium]|nr:ATP-binding protein [Bacteroidales bacterium]